MQIKVTFQDEAARVHEETHNGSLVEILNKFKLEQVRKLQGQNGEINFKGNECIGFYHLLIKPFSSGLFYTDKEVSWEEAVFSHFATGRPIIDCDGQTIRFVDNQFTHTAF